MRGVEMKEYDLIIIGGGAAGFAAVNKANELGKSTLMINDSKRLLLGGTCVNVGCVPTKVMLYQGEVYYRALHSGFNSIKMNGKADFVEALRETRRIVDELRRKNYEKVVEGQEHVDFLDGEARIADKNTVYVGGKRFKARFLLIATGSRANVPKIKGIESVPYFTNRNIFSIKKRPNKAIIIGSGPQAMEFACMFNHF